MLGDRHGDAGDVHFLKRVGAEQLAADLSGNTNNGRRIEHRGGNPGDHVGGAGAGSCHRHPNAPGGTCVSVGHVRRSLLVPHQYVVQL